VPVQPCKDAEVQQGACDICGKLLESLAAHTLGTCNRIPVAVIKCRTGRRHMRRCVPSQWATRPMQTSQGMQVSKWCSVYTHNDY
jgi:hypothetical protein